jgi:hypothetical protein
MTDFHTCDTCETTYRCTDLEHCCGPLLKPPPYAKRLSALRNRYRGLQGTMPPFGDVIFLLRLLDEIEDEFHGQCPSCSYHTGHDPKEWFEEKARLRGWVKT